MGLFSIVYFCSWAFILKANEKLTTVEVALICGVVYVMMIWSGKVYSKCYFNPALTLCDFYLKNISLNKAIYVVVSQLIGAYIGSLFIYYTVPQILLNQAANEDAALGGVYFNVKYSFINGIIVEALLSFVLAIIYFTSI